MAPVSSEIQIEPYDLQQMQRWVDAGRFVDLADAAQSAIHTGIGWWLFEEFVTWERETYGGMTDEEFHKAIAEEGMVPFTKPQPPPPPRPTPLRVVVPDDIDDRLAMAPDDSEWESARQEEIRARLRYLIQQRRWSCGKIAERLAWEGCSTSAEAVAKWYRGQQKPGDPDAIVDYLNRMLVE